MRSEAILSFIAVLVASSGASAQGTVFAANYTAGRPLAQITTPTLQPGTCYEFQTTSLSSGADSIMAIRTSAFPDATTVVGADDCSSPGGSGSLGPSCVRFCVNAAQFPTARTFSIWVWGYSAATGGTANLRAQIVSSSTASPLSALCIGSGAPIRSGCWSTLSSNFSFGGLRRPNEYSSGWLQFETTQIPGSDPTLSGGSIIFFTGDGLAQNWNIARVTGVADGWPGTHRRQIDLTAQLTLTRPAIPGTRWTVVAAPYGGTTRLRLLQNDRVRASESTGVLAGTDVDNDGLGASLEHVLGSCDSAATPTPSGGYACSTLVNCTSSMTSTSTMTSNCAQSMRDADQDGIRDDLELYGVYLTSPTTDTVRLAEYGANPARYDMFVELDYDQPFVNTITAACDDGTGTSMEPAANSTPVYQRSQLSAMATQFRATTTATFRNRDGTAGIFAHFDSGPLATSVLATDEFAGDYGGSSCITFPSACTDAVCTSLGGSCCTAQQQLNGSCQAGQCMYDPHRFVAATRRWLFRNTVVSSGVGGQSVPCSLFSWSASPAATVHEIGHQGCLMHEGPLHAQMGSAGIHRVNYISRMNYLYDYTGGTELDGAGGFEASSFSFSQGLLPTLRPRAVVETCPLGNTPLVDALDAETTFPIRTSGSCFDVDWNQDGAFAASGVTVEARLGAGAERHSRGVVAPANSFTAQSGPSIVRLGNSLMRMRVVATSATANPVIGISTGGTFVCPEEPAATGPRFGACPFVSGTETTAGLSGGRVPVAIAADSTTLGSQTVAFFVYRDRDGRLGYGEADQFTSVVDRGVFYSGGLPALNTGRGFPSVARIGGTQSVAVVFQNASGDIVEYVATPTVGGWNWSSPRTVVAAAPDLLGSPALTTIENSALGTNGLLMAVERRPGTGASSFQVWHRTSAVPPANPNWTLTSATIQATTESWGRPGFEVWRQRVGAADVERAMLTFVSAIPEALVTMSPAGTLSGTWGFRTSALTSDTQPHLLFSDFSGPPLAAHAPALLWDDRPGITRGLRAIDTHAAGGCQDPDAPACPTGTSCQPLAAGTRGISSCTTPDGLVTGRETRLPAADGVEPSTLPDFDDWRELRYALCDRLRREAAAIAPAAFADDQRSCVPAPVYPR